jgi:GT2 family glycosyltransferase/glycosyltransferase involved in cell wall biosynthesis
MAETEAKKPKIDPRDPLDLNDPVLLRGAANWYKEQFELFYSALWEQERVKLDHFNTEREQQKKQTDELLQKVAQLQHDNAELHKPGVIIKKGLRKILRKAKSVTGSSTGGNATTSAPEKKPLVLVKPEAPVVSVVIPMFNLLDITVQCLESLVRVKEATPFEVIVVDDASTEPTVQPTLEKVPGLTYIRQKTNGGFVPSCNAGAAAARGEFVYFLNNDTQVQDHWLSTALELFKNPKVGAVGSKLMYPTGKLQEAGGVIFKNAEGWNYGKTDLPDRPEYNFVRDVDYCSGAGLMVRQALFNAMGGFNKELAPGYYEDADLCFRLREKGFRVLYQPLSVIMHHEGASSASNVVQGKKPMKAYQEVNFGKFKKMHAQALAKQWEKDLRYLGLAARRKRGLRIWVFNDILPTYDRDYGSQRTFDILRVLAKDHTLTYVSLDHIDRPKYRQALEQMGIEVVLRKPGVNLNNRMIVEGPFIDAVILMRPDVAHRFYFPVKEFCPNAKIFYDTVDIQHVSLARQLVHAKKASEKAELEAKIAYYKAIETEYAKRADRVWAITPADQKQLRALVPKKPIDIVSVAHEISAVIPEFKKRTNIFFVGSFFHPPNVGAMEYFIGKVLPLVQKTIPDVVLNIVGQAVPDTLKKMATKNIVFHGPVSAEALESFYRESKVFVSPHLYGSGLKGKIIMSMAHGLPVVVTSIGAEGIPSENGENLMIADDAESFAREVMRLYTDETLWQKISNGGRRLVREQYSSENLAKQINQSLENGFAAGHVAEATLPVDALART